MYHLAYPPNCLDNINQRNLLSEDVQIGPVMVPVFFPLRLILMLIWPIIWLIYQVCHFTIVVSIVYTYNTIASTVLYRINLSERYYRPVPADGLLYHIIEVPATYVYSAVKSFVQFTLNLFGTFYQNVAVVSAACIATAVGVFIPSVTGSFGRLYQNTKRICTDTIVPFGCSMLRPLYPVYDYILKIPSIYTYGSASLLVLFITVIPGRAYERCTDAVSLIFWSLVRTFYPVYHHIIKIPFVSVYQNYIAFFVFCALYIFGVPRRTYLFARRTIIDRFAEAIDRFIGAERAFVQRMFISIETKLGQIYEGIEKLNSIMYKFVYFPVDIQRGTPFWVRFTYYAFFCIHIILLLYMCVCCYLQLAVLFVSEVIYDK